MKVKGRLVLVVMTVFAARAVASAPPRLWAALPSPALHPLAGRRHAPAPALSLFTPHIPPVDTTNCTIFCPGFAALRGLNSQAPDTWAAAIQLYTQQLAVASMAWPDYGVAAQSQWPALAAALANASLPVTDLAGFVPGGMQDYDVASFPAFAQGVAALGPLFLGMDMGEQDVRWLWGYAKHTVLAGPAQRLEQLLAFRDFSWAIEDQTNGTLVALASSVYGVHHWLQSGLYTLAGAETSQSNGNAQVLYAFVRGAAKQYGSLWYGQVSIFNWFGYKIPGDPAPMSTCTDQSDHSPTCGTSLNLMKRLMYTQLAYDSAYFAFEGGLTMASGSANTISPIGTMQAQAMQFFAAHGGSGPSGLGVHVPTIGLLLDAVGGWVRPCDTRPQTYTAASWGNLPWDSADFLADAVLDEVSAMVMLAVAMACT